MQHHVHRGNAQHGDVEVKAMEHVLLDVFPMLGGNEVAGVSHMEPFTPTSLPGEPARGMSEEFAADAGGSCLIDGRRRRCAVYAAFHELNQKSPGAAGGIADGPR